MTNFEDNINPLDSILDTLNEENLGLQLDAARLDRIRELVGEQNRAVVYELGKIRGRQEVVHKIGAAVMAESAFANDPELLGLFGAELPIKDVDKNQDQYQQLFLFDK